MAQALAIDNRFDRMVRGEPMDGERLRDDAWALWSDLVDARFAAMVGESPVDAEAVRALVIASRVSLCLEAMTGVDWKRASKCAVALTMGVSSLLAGPDQLRAEEWRALADRLRRISNLAAYVLHRAGYPSDAPPVIEALTALQLGQQMNMRSWEALAELRPDVLREVADAAPVLLAARDDLVATMSEPEASEPHSDNAPPAGPFGSIEVGNFLSSGATTYAPRAAQVTGRHVLYLVAAAHGGAVLRVDSTGAAGTSVELPDLPLMAAMEILGLIRNAPLRKRARAAALRAALEHVGVRVWQVILKRWPDLRHVPFALVPLGEAAQLPLFTALVDGVPAGARLDFTIAPSARSLLLAGSQPSDGLRPTVVVADPAADRPELPEIAHTVEEADRVAAVHGVGAHILQGPDSQRDSVLDLIGGSRLVHLACHGSVNHAQPFESLLHLGSGLRLEQVWQHRLRDGPVVVLSACEIGGISAEHPSEQLGFPAVLLTCGARAVVAALWAVPDSPETVRLMTELHRLIRQGLPPNIALGSAVGNLNKQGISPSVWAPFGYFGAA